MNMMVDNTKVALVVGASGIIGHAVSEELKRNGWRVRALGRRAVDGVESVVADLMDANATAAALTMAKDTTHVFYAALNPDPDLSQEASQNAGMLGNLLDGLEQAGAPLQRVVIYQGFKIYGVTLGHQGPHAGAGKRPCAYATQYLSCPGSAVEKARRAQQVGLCRPAS